MDFAYWWSFSGGGSAINGATPSSLFGNWFFPGFFSETCQIIYPERNFVLKLYQNKWIFSILSGSNPDFVQKHIFPKKKCCPKNSLEFFLYKLFQRKCIFSILSGNIPGFVGKQILSRNLSRNMSRNRFCPETFSRINETFPYYLEMFQIK